MTETQTILYNDEEEEIRSMAERIIKYTEECSKIKNIKDIQKHVKHIELLAKHIVRQIDANVELERIIKA